MVSCIYFKAEADKAIRVYCHGKKADECSACYFVKKVNTGSDFKALLRSNSPVRIKKSGEFLILMSVLCKKVVFSDFSHLESKRMRIF